MAFRANIAIVGGSLCGLVAARQLRDAGHRVEVFDRERQLGGRMMGERHEGLRFETGAQYITARSKDFKRWLDAMTLAGHVTSWSPRLSFGGTDLTGDFTPRDWYVGTPSMGSIVRSQAEDIRVHLGHRVQGLRRDKNQWHIQIQDSDFEHGPFHVVLVTAPAPVSFPLVRDHTDVFDDMTQVRMMPVWSVMLHFDSPLAVEFDVGSRLSDSIAWIARDSSKPARKRQHETWIVHSSPDFSREFADEMPEDVAIELWEEAKTVMGLAGAEPVITMARLWRYALVERTLGASCMFSRELMLGTGGDWCLGARAEAAYESGNALARRVSDTLMSM